MQPPTPLLPAEAISKDRKTSLRKAVGVKEGFVNWELTVRLLFISFKSHSGSVVYLHLLKENFRRVFVLEGKLRVYP